MVLVIMAERWKAAVSYRDIFETLASRTITMMCDTERETSLVPGLPASRQPWVAEQPAVEHLPLEEWMDNMADTGMCEGVQSMLDGFLGDWETSGFQT